MSSFSPCFVQSLLKNIFPGCLRKTQLVNLSLAVFSLSKARKGIMSEIVREVPGAVKHKHRLKRLWRFVSNHRVKPERLVSFWISWCLGQFAPNRYVPVAIDWTSLPGNLPCLMATIPFKGRAIPLLWQIVPYGNLKDSQNRVEERLVARLLNLFPKDKKVILIADRGFGRAEFVKFLLKKKILFVLRVRSEVKITTKQGKTILLSQLNLKPDCPYWFAKIAYRQDGLVFGVNLTAIVAQDSDDPWFLVTNLRKPESTIARYEVRFQIEEWFKDLKHRLGIADLQTKNLKRVRRILFLACVAYGLLMLVGLVADRFSTWKEQLIARGKNTCSAIWLALRIIHYQLAPAFFWQRVWTKGRGP